MILGLIALIIIVVGGALYYRNKSDIQKYTEIEYLQYLKDINDFNNTIKDLNDYVTWVYCDELKKRYSKAGKFFKNKTNFYKKEQSVKIFNTIYNDIDNYVIDFNKEFVSNQKEVLKSYFDNIEGKKLDEQQRDAIVTDEYSNLIIAGAGSGKTLTIIAKVKYLIEKRNVNLQNILLLSFTKKTVEELNERLQKIGIHTQATTFHKFGYDLIKKYRINIPAIANDSTLGKVVREYLQKDIYHNSEALESYIQYVACYMNIPEENDSYNSLGEKLDTEKGIDLQTLKSKCEPLNKVSKSSLDTIQGERVKSIEELTIANFLFLNGIEYEYEKRYPYEEIVYRPDFYLIEYDIWLEHFGIDENNRARWLTPYNERKYVEEIQLKRQTHKKNSTKLLETYSYFSRKNALLERLKEMLRVENVSFNPIEPKEIFNKLSQNDERFGSEINKLLESFINLSKSRKLSQDLLNKLFSDKSLAKSEFMLERQKTFLKFASPIIEKYDLTLQERKEIDFNDMINNAADLTDNNKAPFKYQYIIIDEYQDISVARFNLINKVRDISGARLICVGDDWQSIYRFAGSDISLFSNFDKYVGKSEKLLIEQTYRNSQPLIDIASRFIQKNPKQIPKNPKSNKEIVGDAIKYVQFDQNTVLDVFIDQIQALVNKYGNKSILVLGRHSFDINELINLSAGNRIKYIEHLDKLEVKGFEELDIRFLTVHRSKGLESDNVIILNLRNHLLGFPNKMSDDPIISLLLSDTEEYRFAEERRLFYVALTRTRNEVLLFVPSVNSLFIDELLTDNNYLLTSSGSSLQTTNCPYCKTGKLVIRHNSKNATQFLGCSHYPDCDQTFSKIEILQNTLLCRSCKSGFMIYRSGKFGDFLGCTNYPNCKETINLS